MHGVNLVYLIGYGLVRIFPRKIKKKWERPFLRVGCMSWWQPIYEVRCSEGPVPTLSEHYLTHRAVLIGKQPYKPGVIYIAQFNANTVPQTNGAEQRA